MTLRRQESLISKNKNLIFNIMAAGVIGYTILLLFRIILGTFQMGDCPNEYREAANIFMTKSIIDGQNIYSLDVLNGENPGLIYLYGPLNSIIAAAISTVFPGNIVAIHYILAVVWMILGASLMARIVYENTSTYFPASVAFLFTIYCNWRYGYVYASPDALGLFLLILFVFVLTRKEFNAKPYLAAFIAIAAFFTKQYFAVIAVTGFLYYLFLSKIGTLKYALTGIITSAVLFVYISVRYPLYWTYALYFVKGVGAGAPSGDIKGTAHNISQISYIGALFIFLLLFTFLHVIEIIIRIVKMDIIIRFLFKEKNRPLISVENDEQIKTEILFFIQMAVAAMILYYIGNNAGAFGSYYLQLFIPGIIVPGLVAANDIRLNLGKWNKSKSTILIVLNAIMILYTINRAEPRLNIVHYSDVDRGLWLSAYDIIDMYRYEDNWYNPLAEYVVMYDNGYIYNTGMPFVVSEKYLNKYNSDKLAQKLFPYAGQIMSKHLEYREEVRNKVLRGDYALVMYMEDQDKVFTRDELAQRYRLFNTYPLKAGSWTWNLSLYVKSTDEILQTFE